MKKIKTKEKLWNLPDNANIMMTVKELKKFIHSLTNGELSKEQIQAIKDLTK